MGILSERLRSLRLARGWTQEELAHVLGYTSKTTVCRIEKDDRGIPMKKVQEFAKRLDVDPAYLMGWDSDEPPPQPMEKAEARYKRLFEQLNEHGQRRAIEYLKDLVANEKYRNDSR